VRRPQNLMARGLGADSELRSVDVQADIQGRVRPRRRLRRCNYAVSGPQRPACGNGNEHAQRGDDGHGQLPSSGFTGAPQIHSAPTVRNSTTDQPANRAVKMIKGFAKNPESTHSRLPLPIPAGNAPIHTPCPTSISVVPAAIASRPPTKM
jgi:hypothetical protein